MMSLVALAYAVTGKLVVDGRKCTERRLTAEGIDIDLRADVGSTLVRQAQVGGQIDLYWEYTGNSLITDNKVTEPLAPHAAYQRVKAPNAVKRPIARQCGVRGFLRTVEKRVVPFAELAVRHD